LKKNEEVGSYDLAVYIAINGFSYHYLL